MDRFKILTNTALAMICLAGRGATQTPEPFRISVDVNLVVLHPTVRDRKGEFASDLQEQDFEVYEDGVRQSIQLVPARGCSGYRRTGCRPQRQHAA